MVQTVYRIPFVGADDSVRPQKSGVFPWSFVGADAHIGPLKCCDFRPTHTFYPIPFVGADDPVRPRNPAIFRGPLLGRFKGVCKGGESKRPLCHSFFQPSTALSFSCEKESGVETALYGRLSVKRRLNLRRGAPRSRPRCRAGARGCSPAPSGCAPGRRG